MQVRTLSKIAVLALAAATVSVVAQGQMQPRKGDTKIYAHEVREAYESPIATVGPADILTIEDTKKSHYKVRTASGDVGFVAKNDLTKLSVANKSRSISFEKVDVEGYLDTHSPVYIIDIGEAESDPISLERSFKEAVRQNIDKETVERM